MVTELYAFQASVQVKSFVIYVFGRLTTAQYCFALEWKKKKNKIYSHCVPTAKRSRTRRNNNRKYVLMPHNNAYVISAYSIYFFYTCSMVLFHSRYLVVFISAPRRQRQQPTRRR